MSSDNQTLVVITKLPIENGFVINPVSGRKISVKGRAYQQLLNKSILKIDPLDLGTLIYEGTNSRDVDAKLNIVSDKHTTLVKQDKIFKRRKNVNKKELQKHIQEISLLVYQENVHLFTSNLKQDQIEELLKNLVQQRLVDESAAPSSLSENDRKIKSSFEYIVENIDSTSEDESESDDDDEDEDENE
jgi:ribosomal protein L12E/L44/L45/RPP1/RPP2